MLSVTTFVLLWAAGSALARAATYAVAVPLAVSAGAAVVLAAAFTGASVHFADRVARGRFALPVTAAAAGCVLASLWLLAPSGLPPLSDQAAPAPRASAAAGAPPVIQVAPPESDTAPPVGTAPDAPRTVAEADQPPPIIAVGPLTPAAVDGPPVPFIGPRISRALIDYSGPGASDDDDDVVRSAGMRKAKAAKAAKAAKLAPGKRCGQRIDHCGTPLGRAKGARKR